MALSPIDLEDDLIGGGGAYVDDEEDGADGNIQTNGGRAAGTGSGG